MFPPPHFRREQFPTPPLPERGCRIFATPKNPHDGKSVKEQQGAIAKDCSSFIATKLNELMSLGKAGLTKEEMPKFPRDTSLMQGVGALWDAPTLEGNSQSPGPKGKSSVVTESLTPKVIKQDEDGRALSTHETVSAGAATEDKVQTIPWRDWARSACALDDAQIAKQVLALAMAANHDHMTYDIPIACIKVGTLIKAVATRDIPVGHLKVPLWFKRDASMVMDGPGVTVHPKAVVAEVSWVRPITPELAEAGVESADAVTVKVHVQPEIKLPKESDAGFVWDPKDSVHPFWFIRRKDHVVRQGDIALNGSCGYRAECDIAANASVVTETVQFVCASEYVHLKTAKAKVDPMVATYEVKLPCIVNTAPILAGQEAVVQWDSAPPPKKQKKTKTQQTAFDQIAANQRKKPRK